MTDPDPRVTCMHCLHNRAMTCISAVAAGLSKRAQQIPLGRDMATLPQHCPAYRARAGAPRSKP